MIYLMHCKCQRATEALVLSMVINCLVCKWIPHGKLFRQLFQLLSVRTFGPSVHQHLMFSASAAPWIWLVPCHPCIHPWIRSVHCHVMVHMTRCVAAGILCTATCSHSVMTCRCLSEGPSRRSPAVLQKQLCTRSKASAFRAGSGQAPIAQLICY